MTKHYLQLRRFRVLLSLVLLAGVMLIAPTGLKSADFNKPQIPVLSLTGERIGYDKTWYPDGRIWLPVTAAGGPAREFLMPVFIDNKWWHYKSSTKAPIYVPDPIYSFEFKLMFDGAAITPIGIQTYHPFRDPEDIRGQNFNGYYQPLARDFSITWNVQNDLTYRRYFLKPGDPDVPLKNRQRGRALKISAQGTKPLPCTDTAKEEFSVLLYVKFRINLEYGKITSDLRDAENTPVYISPDTIRYNDVNIRMEAPFNKLRKYYPYVADDYGDPNAQTGLGGMDNNQVPALWATEPHLNGTVYLRLTEKIPNIWYELSRQGLQPPMWDPSNKPDVCSDGQWVLREPITVDSGKVHKPTWVNGELKFTLLNSVSESRLVDIDVESDQPWLLFRIDSKDKGKYTPVNRDATKGYIYYIDNAILGRGSDAPDPMGEATLQDQIVDIYIKCDPDKIVDSPIGGEKAGIYTGYITIKSMTSEINPVRMRITFINFRNPFEPDDGKLVGGSFRKQHRGINIGVKNSRGLTGDQTHIVFGTGHRATDDADMLFGEFAYKSAQSGFGARFYHPDEQYRINHNLVFGYGDMLPNSDFPYSESRDIRDANDTTQSYVYLCRFNAAGAQNYPVIVEWDTTDFPEGSQLFISDTLNGNLFPSVNMREATHTTGNKLGIIIQDPNITSFKIEYTVPRVIKYIDDFGKPKINKGWNLLSLPVRPKNSKWNVVYPNAINRPYYWSQNQFQDADLLKVGVGYYIKYSDSIDTRFAGTYIRRITKATSGAGEDGIADMIKIYPGWNTIGTVTLPMNVKNIDFDEFNQERPSKPFVTKHGIWGYKTDEGYKEVSILEPGMGYWMKADVDPPKHGYLKLINDVARLGDAVNEDKVMAQENSAQIIVRDNAQHLGTVYMSNDNNLDVTTFEMPPMPPADLFDIRFNTNTNVVTENSSIIKLQGVDYPLSLSIVNADADYTFIDAVTGKELGKIEKGSTSNLEIKNTVANAIKVLKSDVTTGFGIACSPNPVALNSVVKFSLIESGNVTIKLFDAIGNEVSTLVNGSFNAGSFSVNLDATAMTSGRYILKLIAGSNTTSTMITVVK